MKTEQLREAFEKAVKEKFGHHKCIDGHHITRMNNNETHYHDERVSWAWKILQATLALLPQQQDVQKLVDTAMQFQAARNGEWERHWLSELRTALNPFIEGKFYEDSSTQQPPRFSEEELKFLRGHLILKHERMTSGGNFIPNGYSCAECRNEWGINEPELHGDTCAYRDLIANLPHTLKEKA